MAVTALTPVQAPGSIAATTANLIMTAANVADGNKFASSGNDIVVIHNTGASAHTVTITGIADPFGRALSQITAESIPAGEYHMYGPMRQLGWIQTDGTILISANHAEIKIGIIKL